MFVLCRFGFDIFYCGQLVELKNDQNISIGEISASTQTKLILTKFHLCSQHF